MQDSIIVHLKQMPKHYVPSPPASMPCPVGKDLQEARAIRQTERRQQFLFARHLLRNALSAMPDICIPPEAWLFSREPDGRPIIAPASDLPQIHFNISHAGPLVAVAVSRTHRVGIDIEAVSQVDDLCLDAALTVTEQARLARMTGMQRNREAIRIWTAKEACAKLLGLGVKLGFDSIEVHFSPCDVILRIGNLLLPRMPFLHSRLLRWKGREHWLALAAMPAAPLPPAWTKPTIAAEEKKILFSE